MCRSPQIIYAVSAEVQECVLDLAHFHFHGVPAVGTEIPTATQNTTKYCDMQPLCVLDLFKLFFMFIKYQREQWSLNLSHHQHHQRLRHLLQ